MTNKTGRSGTIAKEVKVELERQVSQVQDAARGIPESFFTEYQAAQRAVDRAIQDSDKEVLKAVNETRKIRRKFEDSFDIKGKPVASNKPTSDEITSVLFGYSPYQFCGPRDFVLPFISGTADSDFNTESHVYDVSQGLVGWGDHSNQHPRIVNTGNGDGQVISGNLDLYWRTQVPHDGIFALRPNQGRSSFPIFGSHNVRGSGWYFSSDDARAEVHSWVIVYLDTQWITFGHWIISSDATRSENRTKNFGAWVNLPGRMTFEAQEGQELGMIVRLHCFTWANEEGLAEINIDKFGIPSNMIEDMNIDVID
jgi:hypothetical protein